MRSIAVAAFVVCSIGAPAVAGAQVGGWISLNATVAKPPRSSIAQTTSFPCCSPNFLGTFESTLTYPAEQQVSFDIGGGIRIARQFGVGAAFSHYSAREAAAISFSVPHPLFVGRPATATGASQAPLEQADTTVHIEARYIGNLPHASVSVFAGPSYFKAKRTVVDDFTYFESLGSSTLNYTVSLAANTTRTYDLPKWGFNVGIDAGYYFGESVGVGLLVRYSKATVDLPNPAQSSSAGQPIDLGGVAIGGGVRFRF